MPLEHPSLAQDGKTYEITGHDKGTVTTERPTTDTTHPKEAHEKSFKRIAWTACFGGMNRRKDRFNFRPVQNSLCIVKRMES